MHQSATDIASFTTGRASILIGPRGAFGAQKQHLLLRDVSRIRAELDRLLLQDSNRMLLRPYIARWGLDPNVLTRSDRSHFADWLSHKAAAGVLGIIVVPDPVVAFAGLVEKQETIILTLKGSQALNASTDPATMLPAGLDDRFLILLSMVPDHMEGAVKRKFNDMIDAIGLETIAIGLLLWIGAHFVPGLNLVVLAFDLFFLSGEVMRAIETVAKSIDDVALARTRSDLTPIAKILAAAIAVLVVNGVLNRFLRAKKITRGQSKSTSSRGRKRTRRSSQTESSGTSRPPRTKTKKKQSDSDGNGETAKKKSPRTGAIKSRKDFDELHGKKFKSKAEADAGWRTYQQSSQTKSDIVIGRQPDTAAGGELGMTHLDDPNWTPRVNDSFIQGGIDSKKPFYLGSNPTKNNLHNPPGSEFPETVFKRELDQLGKAGYTQKGDYMIPPAN